MEELKKCPFCGENKARLVYMNGETQEVICVDTDEELNNSKIYAYVHCYGCDIDFCADTMENPKDVIKAWNNRGIPKGEYGEAIQFACEELIKHPDCLKAVLIQYDSLVKQQMENHENMELPYWCYGWGSHKE